MRTHQRGFTLVELMIAVAIVGILAGIAIFMFTGQTRQAKADAEVQAMFAEFKLRQEQHHVENSTYVSTGASDTDYWPPTPSGSKQATSLAPLPSEWQELRMSPDKTAVYCSYVTRAGAGGDDSNIGATASSFGMTSAPARNWYYVIAECDFDDDPAQNSLYFTRSDQDGYQVQNEGD